MFKKILPILFAVALPIIIVLPVSAQLSPSRSLGPLGATIDFFGESRAVGASGLGVFPSSGINGNFNYSGGEQFGIYENWSNPTIRSDRWTGQDGPAQEIKREIKGNTLLMRYRREGLVAENEGFVGVQQRMNARNSADIYKIEVDFVVKTMTVNGCPTNPNYKMTRIRPALISLGRFNDGFSTGPTDQTGDHFIRVLVNREADSTDPKGVLTVQAFIFRCIDNICSNAFSFPGQYNLAVGKVKVGKKFTLRAVWDEPNDRFLVGVNDEPDVILAYDGVLNQGPPAIPFAQFGIQLVASNCEAGPTVTDAETWVGDVGTNPSAIIP